MLRLSSLSRQCVPLLLFDSAGGAISPLLLQFLGRSFSTGQQENKPLASKEEEKQQQQEQQQQEQQHRAGGPSSSGHTGGGGSGDEEEGASPDAVAQTFRAQTPEWYARGMQWIVGQHLDSPQLTTWSYLYQRPRPWLSQLFWRQGASVATPLLRLEYRGPAQVAAPLLEEVQADFDLQGFQQGVADALSAAVDCYSRGDWQSLQPMVSAGLLASLQGAYEAQHEAAQSLNIRIEEVSLEVAPSDVQLVCAHAIEQHQLAQVDEARSKEQLPQQQQGQQQDERVAWDCAHVYAEGRLHVSVAAADGSGSREQLELPKSGHAVLCRGPLLANKQLPADNDVPWFFLAWL